MKKPRFDTPAEKRDVVLGKDGLPVIVGDDRHARVKLFCPFCISETCSITATRYNSLYGQCTACGTRFFLNTPASAALFSAMQRIYRDELSRNLIIDMLATNCDVEEGLKG